jgi:hypothetical protein
MTHSSLSVRITLAYCHLSGYNEIVLMVLLEGADMDITNIQ